MEPADLLLLYPGGYPVQIDVAQARTGQGLAPAGIVVYAESQLHKFTSLPDGSRNGRPMEGAHMKACRLGRGEASVVRRVVLVALAAAGAIGWNSPAMAQKLDAKGIGRTEVIRRDFDATREAIQVRVEFGPHVAFPKHSHPGVEIAYVLSGVIEYEMNGKPVLLKAGDALYIPAGTVHSARNTGDTNATELATYVVEKNKPLVVLDQPKK
jgi:quercetin dioxygenase-like cupin family protein